MYGCLRGLLSKATQIGVYRTLFRKDLGGLFWRLNSGWIYQDLFSSQRPPLQVQYVT